MLTNPKVVVNPLGDERINSDRSWSRAVGWISLRSSTLQFINSARLEHYTSCGRGREGLAGAGYRNSDGRPPTRSAVAAPDRHRTGRPPESRCRPTPPPAPAAGHNLRTCRGSGPVRHSLGTPGSGRTRKPRMFAGFAGHWGPHRFCLGRFCLGRFRLAVTLRRNGVGVRVPRALAVPQRLTARRLQTVFSGLIQAVPRLLEIRQQPQRQILQRLRVQEPDVGIVDLTEAMGAQVHDGRSGRLQL